MALAQVAGFFRLYLQLGFCGVGLVVPSGNELFTNVVVYFCTISKKNCSYQMVFHFICSWMTLALGAPPIQGLVVVCSFFRCGAGNASPLDGRDCCHSILTLITATTTFSPRGLTSGMWSPNRQRTHWRRTRGTPTSLTRSPWIR